MNRIDRKFSQLRSRGKKAFIAFITAGYPDLAQTQKLLFALEESGADIVELGVPFTDPMADGPVIQEASRYALRRGVTLERIMRMVAKARSLGLQVPVCLMTYYNPVFVYGEKRFVEQAHACGVDGVIIPDLPPEEAVQLRRCAAARTFATIFFASPTSTMPRIKAAARASRGFLYYVSLTGVTGARDSLPKDTSAKVRQIKKAVSLPVCVGFGVSNPSQVAAVWKVADGVIVGSALVRLITSHLRSPRMAQALSRFVRHLKGG